MPTPPPAAGAPPEAGDPASPAERRAWYMYDWANSVFVTSVVTVFIGPYLTTVAQAGADADGRISVLGWSMSATSLYPYATSLSVLLQIVLLPAIGALADHTGRKRALMGALAYIGAVTTTGLYFVQGDGYLLGAGLFVVANLAFGASIVVYNAFLPEIAAPDDRDKVSSRGWATGYGGGFTLLLLNLVLYLQHENFGLDEGHAVRICMASAGVWWALFALIPLARLRDRRRAGTPDAPQSGGRAVRASFRQLGRTLKGLPAYPGTLLFLLGYILFNDGIQTVIAFASTFADQALDLDQTVQIGTILMVQLVAVGGALLLGMLARRFGTKRTILASLVVWCMVVGAAQLVQPGSAVQFYILGFFIAIVLGGTQALSRSMFSHLIPPGKEAEYFGLYEISDKGSAFLGALTVGVVLDATGDDYRLAILSLLVFFVLGFVILAAVNIPKAIARAGNPVPARI